MKVLQSLKKLVQIWRKLHLTLLKVLQSLYNTGEGATVIDKAGANMEEAASDTVEGATVII